MAFEEEKTNAYPILKRKARAGDRRACVRGASLVIDSRKPERSRAPWPPREKINLS